MTDEIRQAEELRYQAQELEHQRGRLDAAAGLPPAQSDGPYLRGYLEVYPLNRIRRKRR